MKDNLEVQENEYGQFVGLPLSNPLPICFLAETLYGKHATLQVLSSAILDPNRMQQVWQCVNSEVDLSCWTYLSYAGFESADELRAALENNFNFKNSIHYLVEVNHAIVGWVGLLNQRSADHVIEIGNIYFSYKMKQSTASTEVIYLLLKACFEQGFRRVEWKCDDLNLPSKRAALRFGFQHEGTFRQDRIAKGRNRNTAWFSILDQEWPKLEKAYLAWLNTDNFDLDGQQKIRLKEFMVD